MGTLVIVNGALVNMGVQLSFDILTSLPLDKYPVKGLLDHRIVLFFNF
jgi:hypothetical protein